MQAYALETAITSLRGNKPFNMGSLYWQINDVWPVSSWATVDYYGTYKAAHYRIKQFYQQLMINVYFETATNEYIAYIVNDYNKIFTFHAAVYITSFSG
jgi:beta-mannosidase